MADAFLTPRFNDQLRSLGRSIPWVPDKNGFSICGDANAPDGMLAVNFLRHYQIYMDYSKKQMILEPNPPDAAPQA